MSHVVSPPALKQGTILSNRFEILRTLGRGGFAIAYLVYDRTRGDDATLKELAPAGSTRDAAGLLHLNDADPHRLRDRFLDEARTLARLDLPGVLPVRATFVENGTAYFATDHVPDCRTLQDLLDQGGPMDVDGALDIFFQVLETLEALHAKRILHRDIKPTNILLTPDGNAVLIDFGAAREWLADASQHQTILFTPGYAPLEQLAEKAARGPATDLYALCATLYHMLAGFPPTPAADRAAGEAVASLKHVRADIEPSVTRAVDAGLALKFADRPQSVQALRDLMSEPIPGVASITLGEYDRQLARLNEFHFERRQCPSCGEPLEEPRPLRKGACPVCHTGMVKMRLLSDRQCPVCKSGVLHRFLNEGPLTACPICRFGRLHTRRASFLSKTLLLACDQCNAEFESMADGMSPASEPDESKPWDEWRAMSGRAAETWRCDACTAQFDIQPDGRRKLITVHKEIEFDCLYAEEWARVAAGLDPGAGNASCNGCGADFFVDDRSLTVLDATDDPFGFAERYLGRRVGLEDARWIAVGKQSPNPGLHCPKCDLEFDADGEYLRLVRSNNATIAAYSGEPFTMEDWHRIAKRVPTVSDEQAFRDGISEAIEKAYLSGEIGFGSPSKLWNGPATDMAQDWSDHLNISTSELFFGGLVRKVRKPLDALVGAASEKDTLLLTFRGSSEPIAYELEPIELSVELRSGIYSTVLAAEQLAQRLNASV